MNTQVTGFGKGLVLGIDAGGTMTDSFIVDTDGRFIVGKAATTPQDESIGFLESVEDALLYAHRDLDVETLFSDLDVILYSGTAMLNALLSRSGQRLGLLVTRGLEDALRQGRGVQSFTEYSYSDRIHAVTHVHPEPLIPKQRIRGVTERIDLEGQIAIPLYEHEVREALTELLEMDVEAICICFLFSYLRPDHERRAAEIAREVIEFAGREVALFLSSETRPVIREVSRLNSTLFEAYAAAPARGHLLNVERAVKQRGFKNELQTMLSYGGLANIRYPRLHETMISGPVGGLLGARHVGAVMGISNIVISDLGGTSFDIGAVTAGRLPIHDEPTLARFMLNLPTIGLESIGAGCGTIVKVDPFTQEISLGPESAGAHPGPVCFGRGGERVTITDCDLVLGYLNPENFLGGKVILDVAAAERAVSEQIAEPLGADLYESAEGVVRLLELEARQALARIVSARGFDISEYTLMGYGGGGPLHLAGYSEGLGFSDVLTFPHAAAFSAFGCTTADYLHRYTRSVHLRVAPGKVGDADDVAAEISKVWDELRSQATRDMEIEGREIGQLELVPLAKLRYTGQLTDVEIVSPVNSVGSAADLERLIAVWEGEYERMNRRVSKYPEAGFSITELGLLASVPKVKPSLPKKPLGAKSPDSAARLGSRRMYRAGAWHEAAIWDMELLGPGNEIIGPAIVEHPATTYLLPPGFRTSLDEFGIFHLIEEGGSNGHRR